MNILFATLVDVNSFGERGIYQDLMRELAGPGHNVYVVSPAERRYNRPTEFFSDEAGGILKVRVGNIQKTGKLEKGVSTVLLESQYVGAVKKHLKGIKFDLVIYSTPPITLGKLIRYVKRRDNAVTYLLLKDIFPQNAVDLGFLSQGSLLYRFFRKKERMLYAMSDFIGCMSPANVMYLLEHNREVDGSAVHVCPNSITQVAPADGADKVEIRKRYGIPQDVKVFAYGGNLGKPQCVSFIVSCLRLAQDKGDRFFLICGEGTDAQLLSDYVREELPGNVKLFDMLPMEEYGELLSACDIGLIFLDYRFTIPNFPSRLLSYMAQGLPVLACTDRATDLGDIIAGGGFGWWCWSGEPEAFDRIADEICGMGGDALREMGKRGRKYLEENYLASQAAGVILESVGRASS
ncbi:MAG: glycosyltransferase family 4 protein [Oscillospiraceae bacterium]|nr:glycosyltransferase family 4 protein [Oscillospiraceae bacterium]